MKHYHFAHHVYIHIEVKVSKMVNTQYLEEGIVKYTE